MKSLPQEINHYEGDDLGAHYHDTFTKFKIYSPEALKLSIEYTLENKKPAYKPLKKMSHGVWEGHINGNLDGVKYRIVVDVLGERIITKDPYAIASTANSTHSVIVNKAKFVPMKHTSPLFSNHMTDAIIYEVSIRDFTSDPSIKAQYPSQYLGMIERNLLTPKGHKAGFDYLKSLGVTHVQILPFFDFEGVDEINPKNNYNWGYNPSQYFVPEGSYATNPSDPYARINELRTMIDTYHAHGMRIVMDVVYNHIYDVLTFPLGKLIPNYCYRKDEAGNLTTVSGCKSDLATERDMVRKLIIDATLYWAKTYQIDGFRFDLMGLIDLKTIQTLETKLKEYRPDIILYGEGWHMPTILPSEQLSHMYNPNLPKNIALFNDYYRDLLKGSVFNHHALGYALGKKDDLDKTVKGILGSSDSLIPFKHPGQSINYVSCHDNHTLYDKIHLATKNQNKKSQYLYQQLANMMILFSMGVPFIHMGQEFYRSKKGIENSFECSDDINRIDWKNIDEHYDEIETFKKAIKLRHSNPLLRLKTYQEIKEHSQVTPFDTGTIIISLKDKNAHLMLIFKNASQEEKLTISNNFDTLLSTTSPVKQNNQLIINEISATLISIKQEE